MVFKIVFFLCKFPSLYIVNMYTLYRALKLQVDFYQVVIYYIEQIYLWSQVSVYFSSYSISPTIPQCVFKSCSPNLNK